MEQHRFDKLYMWSIVVFGSSITVFSISRLPFEQLNLRFLLLALLVATSSLVALRIPRVSGRITVADTFIFLTMLLYGGAAAVVMSALEGVCSTLLISKKPRTILLNSAVLAISTFITASVLASFWITVGNCFGGLFSELPGGHLRDGACTVHR